ncbi:protoporphyrinogen oxidase HemJ [Thiofilum flexile]|uniref:protoporphyrinogen oxidase HemJ n=1 Tax=Thiofilum flexile TaxID=125627 RepID=UPI000379C1B8|nr:protoporphyrinogen oxidase HemJ [Thiofilum flexile]
MDSLYIWIKALHVIFMVTWFAGLFYLPRLYVYHAMPENQTSFELFKVMERRLFGIMTIGAILTLVFGITMLVLGQGVLFKMGWFHAKLLLLLALFAYHYACYRFMLAFRADANQHSQRWYRYFNEIPGLLLILIVLLAVVKPF